MKNEVKENTQKKENIEYKAQIRKVCPMCEREVILRLTSRRWSWKSISAMED